MTEKFYAVKRGFTKGIVTSLKAYNKATTGYPNACGKRFNSREAAELWLAENDDVEQIEDILKTKKEYARMTGGQTMPGIGVPKTIQQALDFDQWRFVSKRGSLSINDEMATEALRLVMCFPMHKLADFYLVCAALNIVAKAEKGGLLESRLHHGLLRLLQGMAAPGIKKGKNGVAFDLHKDKPDCRRMLIELGNFQFVFPFRASTIAEFAPVRNHPARKSLRWDKKDRQADALNLLASARWAAEHFSTASCEEYEQILQEQAQKDAAGMDKMTSFAPASETAGLNKSDKGTDGEKTAAASVQGIPEQPQLIVCQEEITGQSEESCEAASSDIVYEKPGGGEERPTSLLAAFKGIQFDKRLFRRMPDSYQKRFARTFASRLQKLSHIFTGDVGAAGNDVKLVRSEHGQRVFKRRVGGRRLAMVYQDGVLTLMKFSNHDRQMQDIRKIKGKSIGYVYYETEDFLRKLAAWPEAGIRERQDLASFLDLPQHYVYDPDQQAILTAGTESENISVVGHAGAGKSIVGLKWLEDELQAGHSCLYLTMSPNLAYTLAYEFQKARESGGGDDKALESRTEIKTTFAFLRESLLASHPELKGRPMLTSGQSFAAFVRFWHSEVDWTRFWDRNDPDFAKRDGETTMQIVWREIHGLLKGAVPLRTDYHRFANLGECLPSSDYEELLRREKKASVRGIVWQEVLYETWRGYQAYLAKRRLLDDNDIARLLLASPSVNKKRNRDVSAFLDECQDLTQVELLAIVHLLSGTRVKRLASDRCQMVQPTYFSERWLRTMANEHDRLQGRKIEQTGLKPRYLHYNYRSSKLVIAFQNYILRYFRESDLLTLKLSELEEIKAPPLAARGQKPVWVQPMERNWRLLVHSFWKQASRSDLQAIFAQEKGRTAKAFPWDKDERPLDIIACKGMEYPSVLLCNILTDMTFDPVMAWKYFYVGATRSNNCLIIYEQAAAENGRIRSFMEEAARRGLIEICEDLEGQRYGESWLDYLEHCLQENVPENRLEMAENAMNYGHFELALRIYAEQGTDEAMTAYCRGKVLETRGDFAEALTCYDSLPAKWSNRGRNRCNSVDSLLEAADIREREFLEAYVLSGRGNDDFVPRAMTAWEEKFGTTRGFYEELFRLMEAKPFTRQVFSDWCRRRDMLLREKTESVVSIAGTFPVSAKKWRA